MSAHGGPGPEAGTGASEPAASLLGVAVRGGRARRFPDVSKPAEPVAPVPPAGTPPPPSPPARVLVARWRAWRTGAGLPALGQIEGQMAQLCPGGVLLAVRGAQVEVARRLPGTAPDVDLSGLEWMRGAAREAARASAPRHELDEAAGLELVALPFALDSVGSGADATAVLCRLAPLVRPARSDSGERGFFSGVLRRLAGA